VGILWGLISAFGYGTADFIARDVSVKLTAYRALLYIHLVSGLMMVAIILFDGIPASSTLDAVALCVGLSIANTVATLMLYRALSIGKISIASPVTSTFGGVALILALLAGDTISTGSVFSLVLMLVGIIFVSIVPDSPDTADQGNGLKGLPEAILSALLFGLYFWGIQFVVGPLGAYVPTLIGRIVTVVLLTAAARPLHQNVEAPSRSFWLKIIAAAVISTIGEVAYNLGVQGTTPGIVAVLSSLFSPVTVLLALIFLRERLARHQWIGVGIIFIATLLIGIFQNLVQA
jgi:uncharacterized membrane protein